MAMQDNVDWHSMQLAMERDIHLMLWRNAATHICASGVENGVDLTSQQHRYKNPFRPAQETMDLWFTKGEKADEVEAKLEVEEDPKPEASPRPSPLCRI